MFQMKNVGRKISELRKEKGLTQMELANHFGISYQAVSNWERGLAMPDISSLTELSEILACSIEEILGDKKAAGILENIQSGQPASQSLQPEEFNALAPLFDAEKNMQLIQAVDTAFDEQEAEIAIQNLSLEAENDYNQLAETLFENHNIAMFSRTRQLPKNYSFRQQKRKTFHLFRFSPGKWLRKQLANVRILLAKRIIWRCLLC